MEIKLKLSEILNLNQTLKLIIDNSETKIDSLFKFKLLGIMKSLEPHVFNFEIIRNEKIREYGKETENGNIGIDPEDTEAIKKFNDALKEVINSDVSININKLKSNEIFDKGVKAEHLMGLYTIIEE